MSSNNRSFLSTWMLAVRAFAFPVSALPVLVGAFASCPASSISWGLLIITTITVVFMHAAGNLLNEYYDFKYGLDKQEADSGRFCGVLPGGILAPHQVFTAAVLFLLVSLFLAFWIVAHTGYWSVVFGLIGVLGLYAYTGPPFTLKYRALGEPTIFAVYGPAIILGSAYVQTGRLDLSAFLLSISIGLLVVEVVLANNLRDRVEDKGAKIRTLVGLAGLPFGKALYLTLLILAPVLLILYVFCGVLPTWTLLALLALPLALPLVRTVMAEDFANLDALTVRFMAVFSVLTIVGLVLGKT